MGNLSPLDVQSLPRVTEVTPNDRIVLLQQNQLVTIAIADFLVGVGESGSFVADGGETITVENGIIVGITP